MAGLHTQLPLIISYHNHIRRFICATKWNLHIILQRALLNVDLLCVAGLRNILEQSQRVN